MTTTAEAKIPEKVFNFQESRFWQKKSGRNKDLLGMDYCDDVPAAQRDKITNRREVEVSQKSERPKQERRQQKTPQCGILPSGPEHPPRVTKKKPDNVHATRSAPFATN